MSDHSPPTVGQTLWGGDLNEYLLYLESRIQDNEAQLSINTAGLGAVTAQVSSNTTNVVAALAELDLRIDALETKTEYEYVYEQTAYTYNAGAPPATTNGQVRFNNTNLALATAMNIKRIDSDGFDRSQWLQMLDNRARVRIQEWDLATVYHRFNVTGPAVLDVNNAQVPIVWYEGNGTLPAQKAVVSYLVALPS